MYNDNILINYTFDKHKIKENPWTITKTIQGLFESYLLGSNINL